MCVAIYNHNYITNESGFRTACLLVSDCVLNTVLMAQSETGRGWGEDGGGIGEAGKRGIGREKMRGDNFF